MRISAILGLLAACMALHAQTCNVTDYTSLKNAIQAANAQTGCTTILVAAGTYTITSPIGIGDPNVAIDILKPVTVKSTEGAGSTIIDANGLGVGIRTAASSTVVDGFTIKNTQWGIRAYDWTKAPSRGSPLSSVVFRNLIVATIGSTGQAIALGDLSLGDVNDSVVELCTVTSTANHGIALTDAHRNLIIDNTIVQTTSGNGIELLDSDYNTVTGNTIGSAGTSIGFDGVDLHGSQYNYIGYNNVVNPHNGVTLTIDPGNGNRQSIRNWIGNNHLLLHNAAGSDGLWFNNNSNFNMAFGNDSTGASENGVSVFSSVGNYLQGNVFYANPFGGIFLDGDPNSDSSCASNCIAADRNSVQQNYLYNHPANGGVTTFSTRNDDVGFNFIAGNPALFSNPIGGLVIQDSAGEKLYSNVIKDLRQPENINATTTSASLYLNRHLNAPDHYSFTPSGTQWDSGSPVLGGNYYSDFTTANGNPSNGSTTYTNIFQDVQGDRGIYKDNYPYQSESLGKTYGVAPILPAAGTYLAAGTFKTISWVSQSCVFVDLTLLNASKNPTTIVTNYADYGYYRWTVPAVTPGAYSIQITCKDSLNNTQTSATTPTFNITTSDLVLLSPQRDLLVDSGAIKVAWSKSVNVGSVDVWIRYSDSDAYTLLQSSVPNDFVALTLASPPGSNRVNVKIVSGGYADSTDGWFSVRSGSTGQFTSPASAGGRWYVGTPYPLEWVSPTGSDYVDIDLMNGNTIAKNMVSKLADFGRYRVLIPDAQGASMSFRLTFHNSAGTVLSTATSPTASVTPGGGFSTNGGGACNVSVSPTSPGVPGPGSTLVLNISNASCGWAATSNAPWLAPTVTSGTSATLSVTVAANATGAQRSGTITVSGQTITVTQAAINNLMIPSLVSISPYQGTGPNATLTFVYAHPNGWSAIASAEFIINPRWEPNTRSGGCYIKYGPGTGLFTLIADDGIGVAGTTAPGSSVNISNSQCTLNAAGSSATTSGTTLTLVVPLTFSSSFTGQRHIWMQAVDYNNLSTNWLVYGVWFPTATSVNAVPWYRIYDPYSNSYLYSADQNEYNTLGTRGFVLQGISGLVMDTPTFVGGISNIAWYRVYVNSTNSHLWTSDRNEFLTLVNQQQAYVGEGVATFVMPYINAQGQVSPQVTNTIPFWRAYYNGANVHFWTSDPHEYPNNLPAGYTAEGIACYIFPTSGAQWSSAPGAPIVTAAASAPAQETTAAPAVVSVANGASYTSNGVVAPGQVLSIFGRHLGGRVLLNGTPVETVSVQDNEIRLVVPNDLAGASELRLEVEHRGRRSRPLMLGVVAANPAIFGTNQYGRGIAQAQNEDGTQNGRAHPAARGSVVTLYTTGYSAGTGSDLPLEVHIGGRPAEVLSAHLSATRAGVIEVQVRVPYLIEPAAFQPVVLHVGNLFSQPGVGLAIE